MTVLAQTMFWGSQILEQSGTADDGFARIVHLHARFVFRIAWSVLRNTHDSEDVVQETFLRLYRSGGWKELENERAFLARSAWRLAVDRIRRRRSVALETTLPDTAASPESTAIAAQENSTVARLIDALPEDFRQPLVLSGIEGLTSREIAAIMNLPEGTVRSRIVRARQIVKAKLQEMENRHEQ
jgi:RNA polymerase sigma-70 factor (ECF subfamily)